MSEVTVNGVLPVLALRGLVIFPEQTIHFDIGRVKSALALEAAMKADQTLLLMPQKNIVDDDPGVNDLFSVGTVVKVKQILKAHHDNVRVLVKGLYRARITDLIQSNPYLSAEVQRINDVSVPNSIKCRALRRDAAAMFGTYVDMTENTAQGIHLRILASDDSGFIADSIAQHSAIDYRDKAKLLCQINPVKRLESVIKLLDMELQMLHIEADIQDKTRAQMDQNQRDYYLREQMKVIREELGEEDEDQEFASYQKKIMTLKLTKSTQEKLLKDIDRLKKQPFGSAEASVLRNYLDTILELPWNSSTKERVDISVARKVLDADHYGLEKVKNRILESIAIRQLAPEMPPQILCLVGPPGVGKTSVAYSVARSLNRKIARVALGGVHDEAEIRGHRKTYVGAMPGRIIAGLIHAGSNNPVLLLDEIDKLGSDHRGDPSAALLEVLDSEQNKTFRDHYLEVPFNLSNVMFITTANTLDTVPRPLLDRMEVIEIGSYTDEEKLSIAKDHLIPKQQKKHGIKKTQLRITDDAVREIIRCYTRESGVRNLERFVAQICRKTGAMLLSDSNKKRYAVNGSNIEEFLGVRKYLPDRIPGTDQVGLVTGLAWTSVGGETLEVEVNIMEGTGKLELTGNLGDVMKESAQGALSYIRTNAQKLGVPADFYKSKDIHIHFPEAAVPKDGPSAGITVCTAIVSALTGITVRRDLAMTGELSIRGRVLPIGGLREKTMAALRHGVRTVIIPKANERDLQEIDPVVRNALNFITAETIDIVLQNALNHKSEIVPTILQEIPENVKAPKNKVLIQQ